ncbi:MAG: T9SS type A sorting domain-containing protein [Sphingobacteriales bacterium]|nr:MAG: T9SS type A sorting domain-containing protein [Sphingobacteriales bacterium]
MKKTLLLLLAATATLGASAQMTLTGNSYSQNFNGLGNGLPMGWAVYTGATASMAGTDVSSTKYTATPAKWNATTGGFRNSASIVGYTAANYTNDSATQAAISDRALAVRQVGSTSTTFPGSDSGAAFVFKMANTVGATNFQLNFKLQSADTASGRTTTWRVETGMMMGSTMMFTPAAATGTLTTGGRTIGSNTVTVNFGTALDNMNHEMWIRIVALTQTTGTGNRATSQIDDFNLTWNGRLAVNNTTVNEMPLTLLGNGTSNDVKATFTAPENGAFTLTVTDLAGRVVATTEHTAVKGQAVALPVSSQSLSSGMYLVRVAQGAFVGNAKLSVR